MGIAEVKDNSITFVPFSNTLFEASREKVSLLGKIQGFVDVGPGRSAISQISSTRVLFSDVV